MKLYLRSEYKSSERRTPLTPKDAKVLIAEGFEIIVETSNNRIFPDSEYQEIGCEIVPFETWKNDDQFLKDDCFIMGLKELPEDWISIRGQHIYFAHIFKGQDHAPIVFKQYQKGNGKLFDLEFLKSSSGKRVAAFGYWAGYVGAALAAKELFQIENNSPSIENLHSFDDLSKFKEFIGHSHGSNKNKAIIIGSLGRCGQGAIDILEELNFELTKWDRQNTESGGPFPRILDHDLFINTVYLSGEIPPFLTKELLDQKQSFLLKVIADVSCDPNSTNNPIPLYQSITSWENPLETVHDNPLKILAIDNLPSILPKESSIDFSAQLLPSLKSLFQHKSPVWEGALAKFHEIKNVTL